MAVVAEGVETEEQHAQLEALACEYGQGYLYSKAVDAESALSLIRQNHGAAQSLAPRDADQSLARLKQILAA
jgi:EAL domain-containing protein (putative c-di-GMP-specific phosphodiesterase class I)